MKEFFIIGPLRTGSSLLSRCIDDHPNVICLCESEINRTLFCERAYHLHFVRMLHHGLKYQEIAKLLTSKRQDDLQSLERWYREIIPILKDRYLKPEVLAAGDKSPDFFKDRQLVDWLKSGQRKLIYTVRDPRAIFSSIKNGPGTPSEVLPRWEAFKRNFQTWRSFVHDENLLVVRYEDLLRSPKETMSAVYQHIGVCSSSRFNEGFQRKFPSRFLWESNTDWKTGVAEQFDAGKIDRWKSKLTHDEVEKVEGDEVVSDFRCMFNYKH